MMMMKIQMDTGKIAAEKRYSAAAIRRTLESAFDRMELRRVRADDEMLIYRDTGSDRDYARFGKIVNSLKKQPWFMENVSFWRLYDSDGDDPAELSEEDLLLHYRRRAS